MRNVAPGYLIVKRFEAMYREFDRPAEGDEILYGIPRRDADPILSPKKYRGVGRDGIIGFPGEPGEDWGWPDFRKPTDAETRLGELERTNRASSDYIFSYEDAVDVLRLMEQPESWELIWAADASTDAPPPTGTKLLGFEPTWFEGDRFSAIMDSMFFPRWHGTDAEGKLFLDYYEQLNEHGLFSEASQAEEFLRFYRSQDWTETGEYVIAEIRSVMK
jgi:hypothetical protein